MKKFNGYFDHNKRRPDTSWHAVVVAVATMIAVSFLILLISIVYLLGINKYDPLDVNRDGVANLVDLSVLAYEINERN